MRIGDPYINWLADERLLPALAEEARIMRYGYKSTWFGKEQVQAQVSTVARRLLYALADTRCSDR
jgi:hypothetical protein